MFLSCKIIAFWRRIQLKGGYEFVNKNGYASYRNFSIDNQILININTFRPIIG